MAHCRSHDLETTTDDPGERKNLSADPAHAEKRQELEQLLTNLLAAEGLTPQRDTMPLDEGIKTELPEATIR